MSKFIRMHKWMQALFDDQRAAAKAAEIGQAMLAAGSLRMTAIASKMTGSAAASYKRIQRFVHDADPRQVLWRLFQEQAEFVMADVTEIERPQAWKTGYVGTLKEGKTKGFWALILATPYRGRAIPCGLITYSSQTLATGLGSRNLSHVQAFEQVKDLLGERPLVLDREFSYLELLHKLVAERVNFVIRLKLGRHPPKFWDSEGREVVLTLSPGETVTPRQVWYKGEVCVNLSGSWGQGFKDPLWIMTNLEAEEGRRIYARRMKIEETFRALKSLLGMTKVMNKQQEIMEKMLALLLLVFAIGLVVGDRLRDRLYGEFVQEQGVIPGQAPTPAAPLRKKGEKWKRYSGLFILLKQKGSLSAQEWQEIATAALMAFLTIVQPPVPTHV